jgi:hypothetical protein
MMGLSVEAFRKIRQIVTTLGYVDAVRTADVCGCVPFRHW